MNQSLSNGVTSFAYGNTGMPYLENYWVEFNGSNQMAFRQIINLFDKLSQIRKCILGWPEMLRKAKLNSSVNTF